VGDAAETAAPAAASAAPMPAAAAPAAAPAAAQAAAPAAAGANLDQLAQDLMLREKKLAEAQQQLQTQREQAAQEAARTAAAAKASAAPQPQQAAAAPAPAAAAEDERLKQLQAEVDKLRKEKEAQAATTVASAAPAARSANPGAEWNAWYRDATGTVRQSLRYPQKSLQGGEEGDVMVKVLLKRDGSVVKTELAERTPYSALNGEALAVFSRIGRFPPIPSDYSPGNPQVEMSMPINFKIAADQ
jgi:TonB family protein